MFASKFFRNIFSIFLWLEGFLIKFLSADLSNDMAVLPVLIAYLRTSYHRNWSLGNFLTEQSENFLKIMAEIQNY